MAVIAVNFGLQVLPSLSAGRNTGQRQLLPMFLAAGSPTSCTLTKIRPPPTCLKLNSPVRSGSGRGMDPCPTYLDLTSLTCAPYSTADHSILEAEYQRNPKPDKAARRSIVQRVALNDKEVQVSFDSMINALSEGSCKRFMETISLGNAANHESFHRYGFKTAAKSRAASLVHCYHMKYTRISAQSKRICMRVLHQASSQ